MSDARFRPIQALVAAAAAALPAVASAGIVMSEDFEDANHQGWTVNGNQMTFPGGNPGTYMGVPYLDFFGIDLRNEDLSSPVNGDITRYGADLSVSVDVRMFNLTSSTGDQINPDWFNLVLELRDYGDPGTGYPYTSVFTVIQGLPQIEEGWVTYNYVIPIQNDLPLGWGGTGDEDPVTFEPRLPENRSYLSVLQNVDEFRITTFEPGYFYGFNFWEMGFDNVNVSAVPAPGTAGLLTLAGLASARRRRA
jgi:hypothetical protein